MVMLNWKPIVTRHKKLVAFILCDGGTKLGTKVFLIWFFILLFQLRVYIKDLVHRFCGSILRILCFFVKLLPNSTGKNNGY